MKPARSLLAALALLAAFIAAATQAATPSPKDSQVYYQIFFRSFHDSNGDRIGDLKGLTSKLGYIRQLGATTILLTPLQPSPYYHNYFATEFKAIDPAYGTMDDYFAFVRAAHAQGLKVYLDQEFQYVAEGHPWWRDAQCNPGSKYADYLIWKDAKHCEAEPFLNKAKWEGYDGRNVGIAMVNLSNPKVRQYFQDLLLYWADPHGDASGRDGIDGIRIDHMMDDLDHKGLQKHLFADFWHPIFQALKARRPNLGILAEQADWGFGTAWLTDGHADAVFAFPMRGALVSLDKRQIVNTIHATDKATPAGKVQVIFLENHDLDRYMSEVHDDPARARAGAAIALMLKGDPLIYYGQELGMRGMQPKNVGTSGGMPLTDAIGIPVREAFRWKAHLDAPGSATWYRRNATFWDARFSRSNDGVSLQEEENCPDSLYRWYARLLAIRHARPEIGSGDQRVLCDDDSAMLCLLREQGGQKTLVLVNLGKTAARPSLGTSLPSGTAWTDLLDDDKPGTTDAVLEPLQVRILGSR